MSEAKNLTTQPKKNRGSKYTYERDKDRQMVKGIFRFHEVPGGCMSFVFKAYDGDEVERYDLIDGEVYTIPLGVAKHLNKNLWYPEYSYIKGEGTHQAFGGNHSMKATKKIRRCSFQSLEFIDIDEVPTIVSPIITVETVDSALHH